MLSYRDKTGWHKVNTFGRPTKAQTDAEIMLAEAMRAVSFSEAPHTIAKELLAMGYDPDAVEAFGNQIARHAHMEGRT